MVEHKWWEMNMIPIGWIKESWRSLWVREWCRQCGCGSWHGPNMNCMTEDACQGQSDINFFDRPDLLEDLNMPTPSNFWFLVEVWLRDGRRILDAMPVCCWRRPGIISGIAIIFIIKKCGALMSLRAECYFIYVWRNRCSGCSVTLTIKRSPKWDKLHPEFTNLEEFDVFYDA